MALSIVMPALELAQETGKVISWLKQEGDSVVQGDPLLEVETDKAVVEIEAPGSGILTNIIAAAGSVVPVGDTIAWLVAPGESAPAEISSARDANHVPGGSASAAVTHSSEARSSSAIKISPKARRLARENGIDIGTVQGSGTDGEILASDVLSLIESRANVKTVPAPNAAPVADEMEVPGVIGRLMAERTAQSWSSVPHFFVVREMDAGELVEAHERLVKSMEPPRGVRLTYTDLMVALVARVLRRHYRLNSSWSKEGIRIHREINIGVALAVKDGVVAPVIHSADTADLGEIAVQRRNRTERAKAGRLLPSDITGATFTISNLGMYGVDAFTAIINPPQAAILAVGRIADRVVPVDHRPGVRPMMTLTLSCDHRVADGARAAEFLNDLAKAILKPEEYL